MTTRNLLLLMLLCGILTLFPACSEDDIPNIPDIPEFEDPVLGTLATEGPVIAQGMVDAFPAIASGNLMPKDVVDPYWDEGCTCLRWSSYDEHYVGPEESWTRGWNFAATFFKDETPQMEFAGTDSISVQFGYSYSQNKWTDENNYVSKYMTLSMVVELMDMGGGVIGISGSGSGTLSYYAAVDGEYTEAYKNFTATLGLTHPLGGCPTGMLDLDLDPASFTVSFDPAGVAYWDYQVGPGSSKTGEFPLQCGG